MEKTKSVVSSIDCYIEKGRSGVVDILLTMVKIIIIFANEN
jgi:hypothetical protein